MRLLKVASDSRGFSPAHCSRTLNSRRHQNAPSRSPFGRVGLTLYVKAWHWDLLARQKPELGQDADQDRIGHTRPVDPINADKRSEFGQIR
ncbi:hypothetical protein ACVWW4_003781 [Bradyrhizobium sp. LB7.1]